MKNQVGLITTSIRDRVSQTAGRFVKTAAFSNIVWLIGEKLFRLVSGLFIGVWLARYLGPTDFGLLSYMLAFVTIFTSISNFGFDGIVVRELVRGHTSQSTIIGTVALLKTFTGFFAASLMLVTISWLQHESASTPLISSAIILSLILLAQSFDIVDFFFQSKLESKYVVLSKCWATAVTAGLRVYLILTNAPFELIVWTYVVESFLTASLFVVTYARYNRQYLERLHFSKDLACSYLKESLPLAVSSIMVVLYMKLDQILLGQMVGAREVGVYSAAVRLSELWYFLPTTIAASLFPLLIRAKKLGSAKYDNYMQGLYNFLTWLFICIALPVSFFSDQIMAFAYGSEFKSAGSILAIHIWSGIFISLGVARGRWLINEGLTRLTFKTQLFGCLTCVVLNLLLIPWLQGLGAAISAIATYFVACYLSCFFFKETLPAGKMITASFLAPLRVAVLLLRRP